jgi:dihydrofolate reductase
MARPDDSLDWAFEYESDEMIAEIMAEIGAVVMGNSGGDPQEDVLPYGGQLKVPQFIVTHHPRDPVTVGGLTFTYVNDLEHAVALAKAAAADKSVALLGASIDQQCLSAGLVDELVLHVAPVIIGAGVRLFDRLPEQDIRLERTGLASSSQITSLRFRVIR